jgi:hypothetical protein
VERVPAEPAAVPGADPADVDGPLVAGGVPGAPAERAGAEGDVAVPGAAGDVRLSSPSMPITTGGSPRPGADEDVDEESRATGVLPPPAPDTTGTASSRPVTTTVQPAPSANRRPPRARRAGVGAGARKRGTSRRTAADRRAESGGPVGRWCNGASRTGDHDSLSK